MSFFSKLYHATQKKCLVLASPPKFYRFAGILSPILMILTLLLLADGLWGGLVKAPADYQQGDGFRLIYIHVPSAFLSLVIYGFMAFSAAWFLIFRVKLADVFMEVCAPLGAMFTFIALVSGSLWGKPMWGTFWIWDARLTAELILLFLYGGIMVLRGAIVDPIRRPKALAILILVGAIDLPIIHYSVIWWNTLHQGRTLTFMGTNHIAPEMAKPLFAMLAGFFCYFLWMLCVKSKTLILKREAKAKWVLAMVNQ